MGSLLLLDLSSKRCLSVVPHGCSGPMGGKLIKILINVLNLSNLTTRPLTYGKELPDTFLSPANYPDLYTLTPRSTWHDNIYFNI